jgi:fused signal recognition particle receptor
MSGSEQRPRLLQRLFGLGGGKTPESKTAAEAADDAAAASAAKAAPKTRPSAKKAPGQKTAQKRAAAPKAGRPKPVKTPAGQPHKRPSQERAVASSGADSGADSDTVETRPGAASPQAQDKRAAGDGAAPKTSWFARLRGGLARSSNSLSENLAAALTKRRLDEDTLDGIEDVLIRADLGVEMATRVRAAVASGRYERGIAPEAVRAILAEEVTKVLKPVAKPLPAVSAKPSVWLVVGVNGTGKTTTIGKLAGQFRRQGMKVMLAAADTFRAAAIDQLKIWGTRICAEVIAAEVGSDPAGVAYAALERAKQEASDLLLIDTAGRMQNKSDLMAELAKIVRVLRKLDQSAPHCVLLVLDATTGQNALNQVALFKDVAGVTGLVVTKLDGTARGGILVAIAERFGLPVYAIGVGEGINDLESFDAQDFARAIAGLGRENAAAA